MWVNLHFYWI